MTHWLDVERPDHPYQAALMAAHRAHRKDRVCELIKLIRQEQAELMEGNK